ncbi:Secreted subtilisin-like serine protease sub4 [Orbilia oligospora]|uniref:Secreted subtilisin-like serine protease sub4 n=1 Tax=Orbilia oligospora TaxID=2813651 RepID=A0A7C8K6U3_ORBOL|nr:Secreted subtilisin-like serine protease sub4 [Orbilia oligospora]
MHNQIILAISLLFTLGLSIGLSSNGGSKFEYTSHALKERAPDTAPSKELWVFAVNSGHGKDPVITDIDNYITSKLGSKAASLKDNKVLDIDGNLLWFYAEVNSEEAQDIKTKWDKTATPFKKFDVPIGTGLTGTVEPTTRGDTKLARRVKRAPEARQARPELCALSQDPKTDDITDPCDYVTHETQGSGVTVYVVGFGANIDHEEFKHLDSKSVQFIFADSKNNHKREDWPNPERVSYGFGTAVLSKLCGLQYGVSRKITPIIAKITDQDGNLNFLKVVQGLMNVYADVVSKSKRNPEANFIILDTLNPNDSPDLAANPDFKNAYIHVIKRLSSMDKVIVVVDTSYRAIENAESWIQIFAPAVDIKVAARPPFLYATMNGTPLAAAAVAGILATFMSMGKIGSQQALAQLYKLAYKRGPTKLHTRVVYNGVWQDTANSINSNNPAADHDGWDQWEYDAEFCRNCIRGSDGEVIRHVLWLPGDCPCPEASSSRGRSAR